MFKYFILLVFLFFIYQSFGYFNDDTVVIKDSFGIEQTICSGFSCEPTMSGIINGYSSFDRYNGSSIMPRIDHIDGSETECIGMFCERKKNDLFGF